VPRAPCPAWSARRRSPPGTSTRSSSRPPSSPTSPRRSR
ncbi:MAG: hypothetical protein AVDCRST_MAG11-998, partial [uncultured Gemmatimonadaceae bacterium]